MPIVSLVIDNSRKAKLDFTIIEDNDMDNEVSIGDKVCLDTECFYVVSLDETNVRMLAEWNLNVGYDLTYQGSYDVNDDDIEWYYYFDEERGYYFSELKYKKINTKKSKIKQDKNRSGWIFGNKNNLRRGTINFAYLSENDFDNDIFNGYWVDSNKNILSKYGSSYPAYVYDDNVLFSEYINDYVNNLKENYKKDIISGDLIKQEELIELGCDGFDCDDAPSWLYQTSYWTGSASSFDKVWGILSDGENSEFDYYFSYNFGVRPVITVSKDLIK